MGVFFGFFCFSGLVAFSSRLVCIWSSLNCKLGNYEKGNFLKSLLREVRHFCSGLRKQCWGRREKSPLKVRHVICLSHSGSHQLSASLGILMHLCMPTQISCSLVDESKWLVNEIESQLYLNIYSEWLKLSFTIINVIFHWVTHSFQIHHSMQGTIVLHNSFEQLIK